MSLWIELHCDARDMDRTLKTGELACWTCRNASEGALSGNTVNELRATVRHIKARAKANGWKKSQKGWSCPSCAIDQ